MTYNELLVLKGSAGLAGQADTAQNIDDMRDSLSAMALIIGLEGTIRKLAADPTSDTPTKTLAEQILLALHPGPTDLTVRIGLPCNHPRLIKAALVPLAEKSVATAVRELPYNADSQFVTEALGFERLLEMAYEQLLLNDGRGRYLINCCHRVEEARKLGNPNLDIGYKPPPDPDDLQMKFDFGKRFI